MTAGAAREINTMTGDNLFFALDEKGNKLYFEETRSGDAVLLALKHERFEDCAELRLLPALSCAKSGDPGFYVVPRKIAMSGDQLVLFNEKKDAVFETTHPLTVTLFINCPAFCGTVAYERNYHFKFRTEVRGGKYSCFAVLDLTVNDRPLEDIRVKVIPAPATSSFSDLAVGFRELKLKEGEFIPLAEKCRRDAAEYARKYPLVRIRMGWKQSPSPVLHQTDENEPEMKVACTFERVRELADALKAEGVAGAELQLVGWNASGHDGRFPQFFPVDERLGGEEELKKTVAHVKRLGYRISLHTNFIDMYEIADSFTWEDAAIGRDGAPVQTGHYSGGLAYHVCMHRQLKNARRELPRIAALGTDGLHFTDVISIVEPDVCFSESHPCSTGEGVRLARELMSYAKELFGGFSSEGCFDFAMRDLDFGLYIDFGDGFRKLEVPTADRLIPFYEMLIHGTVLYNPSSPTVNYPIKPPADRLSFFMRGGRPALYVYSRFRTGAANWMGETDLTLDSDEELRRTAATVADAAAEYAPLADRQFLFIDRLEYPEGCICVATYSDGSRMAGNYSAEPAVFEGKTVGPFGWIIL